MNKKALLAISIAVFIPLFSYFILRVASNDAVVMPNHYLPDSVTSSNVDGKIVTDTAWHKVSDIRLINQLGDSVNLYDIKGKIIVADFIFTSCGYQCPKLTKNMVKLQQSFLKGGDPMRENDSSIVQFVSFTIDPERDSVAALKAYADKFGVNDDNWWMLTGSKDSIYNYIFQELKVDKYDLNEVIDPNFAHTQRFVLIDKEFKIRGFYNGLDTAALGLLAKDIGLLMLEKATNPESLPFDPVLMGIFFAITLVVVILLTIILSRNKKKEEENY